jgi:hypothetical protein
MKRALVGVVLSLISCGGSGDSAGTAPPVSNAPLAMGAISGDKQVVVAGANDSLPLPVVIRVVQRPDGSTALIRELPNRFLDLLVPRAFAQGTGTTVNGSPISGASVCAHDVSGYHILTPWQPCVNSDANGLAYFFFSPDTLAGISASEIHGTKDGHPEVFDTTTAIVLPGPPVVALFQLSLLYAGHPNKMSHAFIRAFDKYGNAVTPDTMTFMGPAGITVAHDTVTASLPERALTLSSSVGGEIRTFVVPAFSDYSLKIQSTCVFKGYVTDPLNANGIPIDSVVLEGIVDSTTYFSENTSEVTGGILWANSTWTNYLYDGSKEPHPFPAVPIQFRAQRPDTLFLYSKPGNYQNDGLIETSSSPLTYKSTTHCWQGGEPYGGTTTITAQ